MEALCPLPQNYQLLLVINHAYDPRTSFDHAQAFRKYVYLVLLKLTLLPDFGD